MYQFSFSSILCLLISPLYINIPPYKITKEAQNYSPSFFVPYYVSPTLYSADAVSVSAAGASSFAASSAALAASACASRAAAFFFANSSAFALF